jgi:hypothetical protein
VEVGYEVTILRVHSSPRRHRRRLRRASVTLVAHGRQRASPQADGGSARLSAPPRGSGLSLDSITGLTVPLIGQLGDVVTDQAVITNFALVENTVGQIVGLEATGVLQLTGGVLGSNVVTEDFSSATSARRSAAWSAA